VTKTGRIDLGGAEDSPTARAAGCTREMQDISTKLRISSARPRARARVCMSHDGRVRARTATYAIRGEAE